MIFGITAMILVGAGWTIYGGIMSKAPKEKVNISVLLFWAFTLAFVLSTVCGVFQGIPQTTARGLAIALFATMISGFFNFWQLEIMSGAMQKGHNGTIWGIVQSGFILPFFMGILFFDVPLTWARGIGLLLALTSVILSGISQGAGSGKWLIPAFAAFLMTGINQCMSNLPSYFPEAENVSSVWRTAGLSLGFILGAISCNIFSLPGFIRDIAAGAVTWKVWKYCLLLDGVNIISSYFFLYPGMDSLSESGVGAIAYPLMVCACLLVFDLYSLFILREKHTLVQWAVLLLCMLGVVGLSLNF